MGQCVICGRAAYANYNGNGILLKDKKPLCGSCVRQLRFLYPVKQEYTSKGDSVRMDELAKLSSGEVADVIKGRWEKLENLREQYSPWNAVFRTDSFQTEKQGIFGFFKPNKNTVRGYVMFGKFNPGDEIVLLHGQRAAKARIDDIALNTLGGYSGEAGYETELYILQKGMELQPGDLIAKK